MHLPVCSCLVIMKENRLQFVLKEENLYCCHVRPTLLLIWNRGGHRDQHTPYGVVKVQGSQGVSLEGRPNDLLEQVIWLQANFKWVQTVVSEKSMNSLRSLTTHHKTDEDAKLGSSRSGTQNQSSSSESPLPETCESLRNFPLKALHKWTLVPLQLLLSSEWVVCALSFWYSDISVYKLRCYNLKPSCKPALANKYPTNCQDTIRTHQSLRKILYQASRTCWCDPKSFFETTTGSVGDNTWNHMPEDLGWNPSLPSVLSLQPGPSWLNIH